MGCRTRPGRLRVRPLEREGEGVDITSQVLREVRTHWIMTSSALDVVTVDIEAEDAGERHRIPVRDFLSRLRAHEIREPLGSLYAAIAVYRVAMAISSPPLKLVADTLHIGQSTATRLMSRARDSDRRRKPASRSRVGRRR